MEAAGQRRSTRPKIFALFLLITRDVVENMGALLTDDDDDDDDGSL